ncbi:cytochrome c-type biogenesis protein [Salinisphaera sp. Q1T1-3]|uniref:cytochrome c-type biogenesis protein n=1 Tax=Salinisphaera sp. Q1T1-3 TaxID=2321229 RepID=UPI000E73A769|nr:cytochrome c-type biogenesis protein [Salinisphaera sp. Q1T1-3]RJS92069.1 cytochrome c-type biogenesis protein CcmH [Salinisphaera sp. Q1T1-3]
MRWTIVAATLLLVVLASGVSSAAPDDALTPAQSARYHELAAQFRCVVCQNRSIAASDAPLAADLREIVARQIREGRTDRQIKAYLVARYGDWVLYDPPFKFGTLLLWLGPFILLLIGLGLIVSLTRRRARSDRDSAADETSLDRDRLAALLAEPDDTPRDTHNSRARR